MTNYENIKSMSVEEMANKIFTYGAIGVCDLCCKFCNDEENCQASHGTDCQQRIMEWLESEAKK